MGRIFWTICAVAFAAFAVSLAFPGLRVQAGAHPASKESAAEGRPRLS
jgi:hypothetical protein